MFKVDVKFDSDEWLYDLNNDKEFAKLMSQTDINYDFTGKERIYYQDWMNNNLEDALASRALLNAFFPNEKVALIHNKTGGFVNDATEYLPKDLTKKDVVLANIYTKIAEKEGDNLVMSFSAGNEDALKAMSVMQLDNRNVNGKVKIISAGSPASIAKLKAFAEPVGIDIVSQHNTWKDPVTWGASGMVGLALLISAAVGLVTFDKMGASLFFTKIPFVGSYVGVYAIPIAVVIVALVVAVAGIATSCAAALAIKQYHSFAGYLNRNEKGLRDALIGWGNERGIETALPARYDETHPATISNA